MVKIEVNWGSSTQGRAYDVALSGIYQLNNVEEHVKNYKPQILVLSGQPGTRRALVDLGHLICKSSSSLLVCGNIVQVINVLEYTKYYQIHFQYYTGAVNRKREGGSIEAILRRIEGIKSQRFL